MTTPRYLDGCAAGSQERGLASSSPAAWSPGDDAWNVNFNNGNADYNDQDNTGFVRAVRVAAPPAGECQGEVSLRALYRAWRAARRHKKPSCNQLAFDTRWAEGLLELQRRLQAGTWSPRPSTCFIAQRPKAREIHAPDFADRVVHHWLVPQLEALFEPAFIHDSFSNRVGKGTHAAVDRLEGFVRQVHSGQGGGWYLQLDVANFFNSIHRPTLWRILRRRMARAGLADVVQRAAHALLRRGPLAPGVHYRGTPAEHARVPAHKRLANAAPGCGLPIGNLSSQFFANVYLDGLDQFVKHQLRVRRYVRYVDDFVLVHHDRAELERCRDAIADYLQRELRLALKPDVKLRRLTDGVDFLGFVVYPTHRLVRRRVVAHARHTLNQWGAGHRRRDAYVATPAQLRAIASTWASYAGHFRRANSHCLLADFRIRFPWLPAIAEQRRSFDYRLEGRSLSIPAPGGAATR